MKQNNALDPKIQYDKYKLVRMYTYDVQDWDTLYEYLNPSKKIFILDIFAKFGFKW